MRIFEQSDARHWSKGKRLEFFDLIFNSIEEDCLKSCNSSDVHVWKINIEYENIK